jgi:hypothetical protein
MANAKKKVTKKVEERKDYHHLGTPEFMETAYNDGDMQYTIVFNANGSNTHFLGKHVQKDDSLILGLSERDAEELCEQLIQAISNRLKSKLERYNLQKKIYYMQELNGNEEDWQESNWNSFNQND